VIIVTDTRGGYELARADTPDAPPSGATFYLIVALVLTVLAVGAVVLLRM